MPVLAIFYAHRCESPVESTNQVGRFYHITFQNAPRWSPGTRLKCQIAAIGEKNHQVSCVHINRWRKSLAIFAGHQIRRDRHIKSPGVSPALRSWQFHYFTLHNNNNNNNEKEGKGLFKDVLFGRQKLNLV